MKRSLPLLLAALAACSTTPRPAPGGPVLIGGELTYRERIALPPGSTARAFLTRDGAAVAEDVTVTTGQQVPLPFALEVPRAALAPGGAYAVSGRIDGPDGAALFESRTTDMIDPRHPPREVGTLTLERTDGR